MADPPSLRQRDGKYANSAKPHDDDDDDDDDL